MIKLAIYVLRLSACIGLLGASENIYAFDSDAHMDLTRASNFNLTRRLPYAFEARACYERFVLGSSEPDAGRNLFNNRSHQEEAERRSDRSFCGAVNVYRSAIANRSPQEFCESMRALGASFHYLQDWGDPSKEVPKKAINWAAPCQLPDGRRPGYFRPPPGRFSDYIRHSISCNVRNNWQSVLPMVQYYESKFRGASHQQLFKWVHQARKANGQFMASYADGTPSWDNGVSWQRKLDETSGILIAAQNQMLQSFVAHANSTQPCVTSDLNDTRITEIEKSGSVRSRDVQICVVDINSVLDDHYDLYVNHRFLGPVKNIKGGSTCYSNYLNRGKNYVQLRLTEKMGQNTRLKITINGGEFSAEFSGTKDHAWAVTAP